MPTYRFLDHNTGEEWEEFMGISAADDYLAENPHIERLVSGAPSLASLEVTVTGLNRMADSRKFCLRLQRQIQPLH